MIRTKQVILGICPSKSNKYTPLAGRMIKKEIIKEYEKTFAIQYRLTHPMIKGEFELSANIYFPKKGHDLDGTLKIILDCMQRIGAIKNDNNLKRLVNYEKFVDRANPRIELMINEL